jgi:hypothetical protein
MVRLLLEIHQAYRMQVSFLSGKTSVQPDTSWGQAQGRRRVGVGVKAS